MNYLRILILFSILEIILSNCTKEVSVELPKTEPKIVLNGYIHPSDILNYTGGLLINVSQTTSILDTTFYLPLSNLKVLVINSPKVDTLKYIDSLSYYYFNDYPDKMKIEDSKPVTVEAFFKGEKYIAIDSMPEKVKINSYNILSNAGRHSDGRLYSEITIEFEDPRSSANYYEIRLSSSQNENSTDDLYHIFSSDPLINSESYYPSLLDMETRFPVSLPFSDKKINGKKQIVRFNYDPPITTDKANVIEHFVFLDFRSISRNYYLYKTSFYKALYNQKDKLFYGNKEPEKIFSNVDNGLGAVVCYQSDKKTIKVNGVKN